MIGTYILPAGIAACMCQYCSYAFHDGWGQLLEYDDVYQSARSETTTQSNHGFHESWDDLRAEIEP